MSRKLFAHQKEENRSGVKAIAEKSHTRMGRILVRIQGAPAGA
jgi:hypothetical protein